MNFKDIKKEILKGIVENCSSDNKQVKKIDVHLKNVKGFLTSFFEDDKNIQPIKKELQIVIDILNKK